MSTIKIYMHCEEQLLKDSLIFPINEIAHIILTCT